MNVELRARSLAWSLALSLLLVQRAFAESPVPTAVLAAVDRYVEQSLRASGVPGTAVAIVKDGEILRVTGYGHDSTGQRVTARSRMRVASLSKSFTALAIMQLVEQGSLVLDAPVRAIVPEFQIADPRGSRITVRHLLHQVSGLADATFPEMSLPQPNSLKGATTRLSTATLVADPGTDWNYHNPNYHLLARIVEVLSGQTFERYLAEHIFGPLRMRSSASLDCGTADGQLADGHILAYGIAIARREPDYFCSGSGAVITSADDLARWLVLQSRAQSPGGRTIISAGGTTAMHTTSPASPIYGFGWYRSTPVGGELRFSHTGVMGTFSAYQGVFPGSGYAIAVLQNASSPWTDPYAIAQGVLMILQGQSPAAPSRAGLIVNVALGALALLTLWLGVTTAARTRQWMDRRAPLAKWRTLLRLLPYAVPIAVFAALPTIGEFAMGRDGNWTIVAFTLPALVVWLGVGAVCSGAIVVMRAWQFARLRS